MYFKRLELVGFKSFCDKTVLNFEPGITAVVGPNGCGKSNIFDAIRWVLGEQSAKSLRGSEMQDVIFNGTDNKEPVGMAEVTLAFDNEAKFFSIEAPEVAITRRLFRSGESEYLLNRASVRLKDILDILLGTGIGAESYSIVAQGKIDLVLSSKPEERRMVFDEASGITKYKAQKRETMRRLEETEQNLLRVNDIITEVKRQIGSLERQANKARRYKEVFEELKNKEINLAVLDKNKIMHNKEEIVLRLKELESKEAELLRILKEQEAKIANRQLEVRGLEENIMSVRNEILNLQNLIVRNEGQINFNSENIKELNSLSSYLGEQLIQLEAKLSVDEEKLEMVKSEYEQINSQIQAKSAMFLEKQSQADELSSAIRNSLDLIADTKKNILSIAANISSCKNDISDFNAKLQIFSSRRRRLDIEKAKTCEEKVIVQDSLRSITSEVELIRKSVGELVVAISGLKGQSDEENISLSGINAEIINLENHKLALESHKEFLEKLKNKYDDIGESLNAVIYLDKQPTESVSGLVVKIKDAAGLSDEDKSYFSPANFKLCGEAKPIELDTQKIQEKINKLSDEIIVLKDSRQEKESLILSILKNIENLEHDLRNQEIMLANKETSMQTIQEKFNKIEEEETLILMELQDVLREVTVIQKNMAESQERLSSLNMQQKSAEDLIVQHEERVAVNSKEKEGLLVTVAQIKTEVESLHKKIISDEATLKILEETYKNDKESLDNSKRQAQEAVCKKQLMEAEINECNLRIEESRIQVNKEECLLKDLEARYKQVAVGADDVVAKIESDRKELDAIKDSLYQLQMQDKDVDYRYMSMKERLLQSYKIDLDNLGDLEQDNNINYDVLSGEIIRLKEKLDSYGTVNLVAIEEYDELKKRYDFLIQQEMDLKNAKESLHQAILKINRTTKQMFLETFEKVKVEFRNYFRILFNGGDAQLFLIDENDPLESGIEIICRPPGKKLQNVLLLSGGEKSMSAIALIFAIFKVKPSPFCILDEIDAALDEANVDRFSRILQEFSKTSQFIVITHNKKTIANANVMYGITMEHSGISKIVSVKFGRNDSKAELEPKVAEVV